MNSESTKSDNNGREPGWFERNVKLIISGVVVACLLTLVAQLVFPMFDEHHPPHFALENVFGFQAALGFLAFVTAVFGGDRPSVSLFELLPGLPIAFRTEPLGTLFAMVASGLWVVTTCYSIGYMRSHKEIHQTRFYACFAVAIFATVGAAKAHQVVFVAVLMISSLLNIAYLIPIPIRGFFSASAPESESQPPKISEAPLFCLIPLCFTAIMGIALFFAADQIYQLLLPITFVQQ